MSAAESANFKRIVEFLCDPATGASEEQCAALRENMARPGVTAAFYQHLMARNVSNFDMSNVNQLPPKLVAAMRKHFPETF
jgi:hypothetical protein